jgi:hypothetical protein
LMRNSFKLCTASFLNLHIHLKIVMRSWYDMSFNVNILSANLFTCRHLKLLSRATTLLLANCSVKSYPLS